MVTTVKTSASYSRLQRGSEIFSRRGIRERALMLIAAMAFVYVAADLGLLSPAQRQQRQANIQTETQQTEINKTNREIAALSEQLARLNSSEKEAELRALQQIIADADALLSEDDGGSLKLSAMLDTLLRTTPGLSLVSLKTLPVVPLLPRGPAASDGTSLKPAIPLAGKASAPEPPPVAVYQHGVELVIQGNFLALLPYMEKLQRYPKRLFWTSAHMEVIRHPDAQLRLVITTLSERAVSVIE